MDRSTMFAGRLAADPGWGDRFVTQAAEVRSLLTSFEELSRLMTTVPPPLLTAMVSGTT